MAGTENRLRLCGERAGLLAGLCRAFAGLPGLLRGPVGDVHDIVQIGRPGRGEQPLHADPLSAAASSTSEKRPPCIISRGDDPRGRRRATHEDGRVTRNRRRSRLIEDATRGEVRVSARADSASFPRFPKLNFVKMASSWSHVTSTHDHTRVRRFVTVSVPHRFMI